MAVALGALGGEQFAALNLGIAADQRNGSFGRNAAGGQFGGALGVELGIGHGLAIAGRVGAVVIVLPGAGGQQARTADQHQQKADIEPMPQLPAADERHQEQNQHHHAGHDQRPDEFGRPGKYLRNWNRNRKYHSGRAAEY